jgi:hypothetical protein
MYYSTSVELFREPILTYFGRLVLCSLPYDANLLRSVRPPSAEDFGLRAHVDVSEERDSASQSA